MNRSHYTRLIMFIGSLTFLLSISLYSYAATFSGEVVDEAGKHVPNIVVSISSSDGDLIKNRHLARVRGPLFPDAKTSKTDASGVFSIKNINTPSINQLTISSEPDLDYEIRKIEMQGVTYHFHKSFAKLHSIFTFGLEEDTDINEVKISVRPRMWIRAQVLTDNGNPLRNAQVKLTIKCRYEEGSHSTTNTETLDHEGKFTRYLGVHGFYTVSVKYQGQYAESKETQLESGKRIDGLTLKLSGNKQITQEPLVVREGPLRANPALMPAIMQRQREGVWAVNPANRHAYKRIYADSYQDAHEQAIEQEAYLVIINDKAEQEWILEVFGQDNYWIGLIDTTKEGNQKWDNGDPVNFVNWDTHILIPDTNISNGNEKGKYHTVLIGVTGKWQQIREGSPIVSITEKAILEKDNLFIGIPIPKKEIE